MQIHLPGLREEKNNGLDEFKFSTSRDQGSQMGQSTYVKQALTNDTGSKVTHHQTLISIFLIFIALLSRSLRSRLSLLGLPELNAKPHIKPKN